MWNKFIKDEKGFTGLEAAIVLIAFVVVAAVFSYVMLGAGFFTTQKSQEVVHTGVTQASSSVEVSGDVIANGDTTDNNIFKYLWKRFKYVDKLYFKRRDRRWDAGKKKIGILLFVLYSISPLPVFYSINSYFKYRDWAWFWHPVVCPLFTITYGVLCLKQALSFRR